MEEDFKAMRDAQLSVIRVGESVWSTWEPRDGEFNLEWLLPVLDMADKYGIKVIIGTPTYAIPNWLRVKHPEIMAERSTGNPIHYGHRQNVDYSQELFVSYANRIVEKIVTRYADHAAVIGWQVDNEPGVEIFHNNLAFSQFTDYLRKKYQSVENLNSTWGLQYWSHSIQDWDELWLPDGNTNACYNIEWRRFQAEITENFISQQADLVRSLARHDQWITTCIAPVRPAQNIYTVAKKLDITAVNIYYAAQDGLAHPQTTQMRKNEIPAAFFIDTTGAASVFRQADIAYSIKQDNFLVPETNASFTMHANQAGVFPSFPGQLKQVALALISRGASMVEYWHWHTLHYGAESYWGGILGHNYQRGRTYDSVAEVGELLEKAGQELLNLKPESDVAIVFSPESRWALEFFSPLRKPQDNRHGADTNSYERIFNAYYEAFFDAGLSINILAPSELSGDVERFVKTHPILVLPAYYIADDKVLEFAEKYALAGGHLITTPRTGYAHLDASIRSEVAPAKLSKISGVHYDEFTNLTQSIPVIGSEISGNAIGWADLLISDGAEVIARYNDPFLSGYPAIVTQKRDRGRITTVGTVPDQDLGRSIGTWVAGLHAIKPIIAASSESVTYSKARTSDGKQLTFIFNWSWTPAQVRLLSSNEIIELGPWDVTIARDI